MFVTRVALRAAGEAHPQSRTATLRLRTSFTVALRHVFDQIRHGDACFEASRYSLLAGILSSAAGPAQPSHVLGGVGWAQPLCAKRDRPELHLPPHTVHNKVESLWAWNSRGRGARSCNCMLGSQIHADLKIFSRWIAIIIDSSKQCFQIIN